MQREKEYDFSCLELLDGKENMQKDLENLLKAEEKGEIGFRLYRWKEKTLSVGYSQPFLYTHIPSVRRPTGGGALIHGLDLCFSYAGIKEDWGGSSHRIYMSFMGAVLELLRNLLPELEMSRYRGTYQGYFCYFYPTLGEITYRGKKLLACAMRVLKKAFLIHGSLFLDMDYEYFEELTGIEKKSLKERVITFRELGIGEGELSELMSSLRGALVIK